MRALSRWGSRRGSRPLSARPVHAAQIGGKNRMNGTETRVGHVISIEGGIVDVRFARGPLPSIASRLLTLSDPEITIEVAALPDRDTVRGLVMNPNPQLRLGLGVRDTGSPIRVPVGEAVLGRMFNLFGDTIDGGEPLEDIRRRPILRLRAASDLRLPEVVESTKCSHFKKKETVVV